MIYLKQLNFSNKIFLVSGFILLAMVYLLCGCQQDQNESTKYKNGTYIGFSDATDHGYAWAQVNIQGDDITEVDLMEITAKGNRKDYDTYEYEKSVAAYEEMPEQFTEADSADIDNYSRCY